MLLRYIYHETKDNSMYGKGTMFIFGAGLYVVATFCAYMLPEEKANSNLKNYESKNSTSRVEYSYGTVDV